MRVIYSLLYIYILIFNILWANNIDPIEQKTLEKLNQIYLDDKINTLSTGIEKLEWISGKFLGRPYVLNNLGDGINSSIDQYPLYRLDVFDCQTYVEMMLAAAISKNAEQFKKHVLAIRYKKMPVTYLHRNHFPEVDWNKSNEEKGYIKDITKTIVDKRKRPIFQISTVYIDRKQWLKNLSANDCRKRNKEQTFDKYKNINELKTQAVEIQGEFAQTSYLPVSELKPYTLSQIPNGAIIEIVRKNWNIKSSMGTDLNVSHMGFVFWKSGTLYFREASSIYHKTIDIKLMDYLEEQIKKNKTVVGIHVEQVII